MPNINRSFLKWQGGKGSIINEIKKHLPPGDRLIEPFVGAGNVFINTDYESYILNDINPDLINTYKIVALLPNSFIRDLASEFHEANNEADYYRCRDWFNLLIPEILGCDAYQKALLFVYLNRHCYNGVCRYNQSGKFNVPFGKSKSIYFPADELALFAEKLQKATLQSTDFETVLFQAGAGDVVYCDPPYLPKSKSADFTGYHTQRFTAADHSRLSAALHAAALRGAFIVLSGSDTAETRSIYDEFTFHEVSARRTSAANAASRKPVTELIGTLSFTKGA